MKLLLILSFLLLPFISMAQHSNDYPTPQQSHLRLKAMRAEQAGKQKEAFEHYEQLCLLSNPSDHDFMQAAKCLISLDRTEEAYTYICEAVRKGGLNRTSIEGQLEEFSSTTKLLFQLKKDYNNLIHCYYQTIPNLEAYLAVEELVARDQFVRKLGDYHLGISEADKDAILQEYYTAEEACDSLAMKQALTKMFASPEPEFKAFSQPLMRTVDSLNMVALQDITEAHGWQPNAWLLLWHQRGNYGKQGTAWDYFQPFIEKEIEQGKLPASFWAPFEDFKSRRESGYTRYGFHPGKVDPVTVNQNRKVIGLAPLTKEEIAQRNANPFSGKVF